MARKVVEMGRNLKFGLEIEFNNDVRRELVVALTRRGVNAVIEGYNHEVRNSWKIITDGSCGYEIVSPILYGFEELEKVCEALNEVGAKVDRRCGVHIHHDANDFRMNNIKNVYRLYDKYINALDSIMPESRRKNNNSYCKNNISLDVIERIEDMEQMRHILADNSTRSMKRYAKVNFCSYLAYGTIEFRQHSGTTDFEKIKNWVIITNKMMERASQGKVVKPTTEKRMNKWNESEIHMMYDFYMEMGISGTEVADYVRDRRKKLNKVA